MFDRLRRVKNQYEELLRRMEEPETYSDPALYARCDREAREMRPLAEAYAAYEKAGSDLEGARKLMNDPEMRELAQEEFQSAKSELARLEHEIRILLLPAYIKCRSVESVRIFRIYIVKIQCHLKCSVKDVLHI